MAARQSFGENMHEEGAAKLLEVAFRHPIKLIANALGVPPPLMLDLGKRHNVPVAALVGTRDHALAQVRAGVDIRSEEHTSELQSLMRISYAVFCLKKKKQHT